MPSKKTGVPVDIRFGQCPNPLCKAWHFEVEGGDFDEINLALDAATWRQIVTMITDNLDGASGTH